MSKYTYIFDFDGTLVDSPELVVHYYNAIAKKQNWQQITPDNREQFRSQNLDMALSQLGVPKWKLVFFPMRVRWAMWKRAREIRMIPGILEILHHLQHNDRPIGVLSSNNNLVVTKVLQLLMINHLFTFIKAQPVKKSKKRILEKTLQKYTLNPATTIYITDEIRDIPPCQEIGIKVVGVTWGINNLTAFSKFTEVPVASTPTELLQIFGHFDSSLQ